MMFSSALLVLAAVAPAFATVYVTAPVDSTSWTANQEQTVSWQDDNTAPALKDFGLSKVSVYVGNQNQQTLVQSIVDSVDVSTTSSIKFTPQASVGENGKYYFVRFESINLKDTTNPQFPALAFSSKYTMSGMTGTFTADVKAQINGAASAPSSPAAGTTSGSAAGTSAPTSSKTASTKAASSTASANSTSSGANAGNGAISAPASALVGVAGAAVAVFSAMFL